MSRDRSVRSAGSVRFVIESLRTPRPRLSAGTRAPQAATVATPCDQVDGAPRGEPPLSLDHLPPRVEVLPRRRPLMPQGFACPPWSASSPSNSAQARPCSCLMSGRTAQVAFRPEAPARQELHQGRPTFPYREKSPTDIPEHGKGTDQNGPLLRRGTPPPDGHGTL